MALTGGERFFNAWQDLVLGVVTRGPVLDLGTSQPYRKEMAILQNTAPRPYLCMDMAPSAAVDVIGDGHLLPFADGTIGSVICSHVLEHVHRPDLVIDEIRRVLQPTGRAYLTFLDMHPYHSQPGVYGDYHRFKKDAIYLLLRDWSAVDVLAGGGIGQVALNFIPTRFQRVAQVLANLVDRAHQTTATNVFYVAGTR